MFKEYDIKKLNEHELKRFNDFKLKNPNKEVKVYLSTYDTLDLGFKLIATIDEPKLVRMYGKYDFGKNYTDITDYDARALIMDNKWHYTKDNDYPEIFGQYEKQHYPQIPCLVQGPGFTGVRYWNVTEQCWDDEEGDDYFCNKEEIIRWRYLDILLEEK